MYYSKSKSLVLGLMMTLSALDREFKYFYKNIDDPEEFKRLITNISDLCHAAKVFPNHKEARIGRVLKGPEEFKRLITSISGLCYAAEVFPNHKKELIGRVLKDPEEFKRLITSISGLREAAEVFPNNKGVLGQDSIEAAIKVIEEKVDIKEIKKNARLMGVLRRRDDSLFSQIPKEIAKKIVADTRDSKHLNDEDTSVIIEQEYKNKPPKKMCTIL